MPVEFCVLGDVVASVEGRVLELGHARQRSVLAVLLVEAPHAVSVDQLVDRVWGDHAPHRVRETLYGYLSRLRKALAPAGQDTRIVRRPGGYALGADAGTVDLHRFRTLAARARAAGEPSAAAPLFGQALGLWRGEPFALCDTPWFASLREELRHERFTVVLDHNDVRLRLGRHAELPAELSTAVEEHPLDERLAGQLMLALYRSGRAADALNRYQELRERLAEELGTDPGPRLRTLHRQILTNDPALAPPEAPEAPAAPEAGSSAPAQDPGTGTAPPAPRAGAAHRPVPRQLPGKPPRFTGRVRELARLGELLSPAESTGTVVISAIGGAGGVGKTWLALHWAHHHLHRFPDGQLYADLRGFDPSADPVPPAAAVRGFLDALGADPARIPADLDGQAGLYRSLTAGRRRDARPGRPHRGRGTATPRPAPRPPPHRRRTRRRRRPAAALRRTAPGHRHPGRPRGRRPGAAPVRAGRGGTGGRRPARRPGHRRRRRRSARGVRHLVRRPGPGSRRGVRAARPRTRPRHRRARRRRAPGPRPAPPAPGRPPRPGTRTGPLPHARPDPPVRRRAGLRPAGGRPARRAPPPAGLLAAHRPRGRRQARPAPRPRPAGRPPAGRGPGEVPDHDAALAWFTAEHAVLLGAVDLAVEHGFDTHVWQLAGSLETFFDYRGHWHDWAATQHTALLAAQRLGNPSWQAGAHRGLGSVHTQTGRLDDGYAHFLHALDLYRRVDDPVSEAHTHRGLGWVRDRQGRPRDSLHHNEQALALYRKAGHLPGQALALNNTGWLHALLGDHRAALDHCTRAVALNQRIGDLHAEAGAWDSLGYAHHHLSQYAEAVGCYERALGLVRGFGDRYGETEILNHLGDTRLAAHDRDAARTVWQQALRIAEDIGHPAVDELHGKLTGLAGTEHAPEGGGA
ncbi:hypothetical protein GCM10023237_06280 [Streptomyces coeruleoprunus]|uniref:BTAD domain-containing putative transcriptional regulator n=1 Tax=Streptomyces coeruleoprunus TaxID=285563 RepID=UPI0031E593AF